MAVSGLIIGFWPRPESFSSFADLQQFSWNLRLLKFYPFRLADILVPLLVSVFVVRWVEQLRQQHLNSRRWTRVFVAGFGIAYALAVTLPGKDRNPGGMDRDTQREWLDICRWIRTETPPDSIVYAVDENWAVKWYTQRPEYVNFKDCPQDAGGIVEWYERQQLLSECSHRAFADETANAADLRELHEITGISYLLSPPIDRVRDSPVYRNQTFCVYALDGADTTNEDHGD